MYSPRGYNNGPVPILSNSNDPLSSHYGNNFHGPFNPGFVNNGSHFLPFGNNGRINPNNNSHGNCNISAFMNIPPPGFNPSGNNNSVHQLPLQGSSAVPFTSNGFVNPPFSVPPPFPGCPLPFSNSTIPHNQNSLFPNYRIPPPTNHSYPQQPMSFTVPPPPIQSPRHNNGKNLPKPTRCNQRSFINNQYTSKNMPFHCEPCDRGFTHDDKYQSHLSEHIICGIEGCSFSAHSKIVEKHILMQHRSGLFNRIIKGNSPEEISKWITERKKQYPTKNRIDSKQAQREEMDKRGERYSEPKKKFNNRYSNDYGRNKNRNKFGDSRQSSYNRRTSNRRTSETDNQDQSSSRTEYRSRKRPQHSIDENYDDGVIRNLAPFRGTGYYLNVVDNESAIDDETKLTSEISLLVCDDSTRSTNFFFDDCGSDPDNNEVTHDCTDPIQLIDESNTLEFCNTNNEVVINACPTYPSNVCLERKNSETDTSYTNDSQNSDVMTSPSVPALSTSLDLLKAYDFSDDEDETGQVLETNKIVSPVMFQVSDDSEPDECSSKAIPEVVRVVSDVTVLPRESTDAADDTDLRKNRKRRRHKEGEKNKDEVDKSEESKIDVEKEIIPDFLNQKRRRRPTLLEKLLAKEIKHERNVILQCVRYVVENNYFDIGQSK